MIITFKSNAGIQLSPHLNSNEFQCQCGNPHYHLFDTGFIQPFERLRHEVNQPIHFNSGYRDPVHNQRIGGVNYSEHTRGIAADIRVDGMDVETLAKLAKEAGFTGIGLYHNRIHVDMGKAREWDMR